MLSPALPTQDAPPAPPAPTRPAPPPGVVAPGRPAGAWARVALAVLVLAASGAARHLQARKYAARALAERNSPFPLKDLPTNLGGWSGIDEALDPQIARATGCTDSAFRTYADLRTGVKIGMIVLYGPTVDVFVHSPENCYSAAGYAQVDGETRMVDVGGRKVPIRRLIFARGEGSRAERQEIYYTWYYDDRWTPDLAEAKRLERIPAIYKVHLSRSVRENELLDVGNPCEDFLARLIPDLDRRIAAAKATGRAG